MARTEEGVVKSMIEVILREQGLIQASKAPEVKCHVGWYFKPVSGGLGTHGIPDFIGHYKGRFFAIEAKKNEKTEPTALQKHQIKAINQSGGLALVVGYTIDMAYFEGWCRKITQEDLKCKDL